MKHPFFIWATVFSTFKKLVGDSEEVQGVEVRVHRVSWHWVRCLPRLSHHVSPALAPPVPSTSPCSLPLAPEADCQLPFLQHLSCCLSSSCLLFFLLLFLVPVGISVCMPISLQIERDLTVSSLSLFPLPLWSSVTMRSLLPTCFLL